jgi:hypothetical protein
VATGAATRTTAEYSVAVTYGDRDRHKDHRPRVYIAYIAQRIWCRSATHRPALPLHARPAGAKGRAIHRESGCVDLNRLSGVQWLRLTRIHSAMAPPIARIGCNPPGGAMRLEGPTRPYHGVREQLPSLCARFGGVGWRCLEYSEAPAPAAILGWRCLIGQSGGRSRPCPSTHSMHPPHIGQLVAGVLDAHLRL